LLEGSEVSFIGNYAEVQGGAISVHAPTVGLDTDIIRLFNTRCFIQYEFNNVPSSIDPAEWKVNEIL
jgi:predicted outer membrane repeat protein